MPKELHGAPPSVMSPTHVSPASALLHRIDPARNMRRFYRLEILPDLFGGVILKREWGHIGARGQSKARWFEDPAAASAALLRQAQRKAKRGYAAQETEESGQTVVAGENGYAEPAEQGPARATQLA